MDLNTVVFGDYTVLDVAIAAGVIIGILLLISVIKKLFAKKEESHHIQMTRCKNCGWQGQVSRYVGVCPKCTSPLGDQLAKPKQNQ